MKQQLPGRLCCAFKTVGPRSCIALAILPREGPRGAQFLFSPLRSLAPLRSIYSFVGTPLAFRRNFVSKVSQEDEEVEEDDDEEEERGGINLEEMFATGAANEHWVRVTINDNWEVSPEAPDASEPPTLYLGRYIGHLNEKKQPHGKGKLYSQDNRSGASTYYVGEFTNGKPHGKGKTVFIQHNTIPRKHKDILPSSVFSWTGKEKLSQLGNIHEGLYENGQYHGKGRIAFLSGDIYEGDFVNGEIQGKGKMISDEGENFYVGEFKKGKYCGNGRLKTKSGDTMEGQWESGELHGYGKATFDDGDVYEGQWVHGSPTGHGKRVSSDGTSYEGEWLDGDFHGNGKLTLADGTILEGQFVLGRTHGKVTVVHKDGHTREAHFDNGVPVAQQ